MAVPLLPMRAQAGLYLLLGAALYSSLGFLLDAVKIDRKTFDDSSPTSTYARRFQKIREDLPAKGRVGYLTDMKQDPGDLEFQLTQYALSPLILEKSGTTQFVVGNMLKAPEAEFLNSKGLVQLRDYGAGVFLFARKAEQK
jgi:hypothetical protein